MMLKIEFPIDCELFVNSYDLDDLVKVVKPVKILGYLTEAESKDLLRVDFRVRQTTKQS